VTTASDGMRTGPAAQDRAIGGDLRPRKWWRERTAND